MTCGHSHDRLAALTLRRSAVLAACLAFAEPAKAEWRAEVVPAPGRVTAIEMVGGEIRVAAGQDWYRVTVDAKLQAAPAPARPAVPAGALPDARVAVGKEFRAWLAEPTRRYRHGVLGDAIEAASLVIERRDGGRDRRRNVRLGAEAVFEDIAPRVARLAGAERLIVVKSYLERGSALAIVDPGSAGIVAETPAIGRPNAWLNPAGVADYDGDGATDIALVRQPHVLGRLEFWSWRDGKLHKTAELADASNHVIGSRALGMSVTADFDGDGRPDLAVPSLDRRTLRLIGFVPQPHDIARVALPARVVTNLGAVMVRGRSSLAAGLESGDLVLVRPAP